MADTAMLNSMGTSLVLSYVSAMGGVKLIRNKLSKGAQAVWENISDTEGFPSFPAFKDRLHRYWSEWGDLDEYGELLGMEGPDEG